MIYLAAAHEPNAGWGKLVALLTAAGVFWLGTAIHQRWLTVKDQTLPPTGEGVTLEGVKPQISAGSDPTVNPSAAVAVKADSDLDEFVQSNVGKMRRAEIIRAARAKYRRSESTIKRAIRRASGPKP